VIYIPVVPNLFTSASCMIIFCACRSMSGYHFEANHCRLLNSYLPPILILFQQTFNTSLQVNGSGNFLRWHSNRREGEGRCVAEKDRDIRLRCCETFLFNKTAVYRNDKHQGRVFLPSSIMPIILQLRPETIEVCGLFVQDLSLEHL
jgi:hypothetical protein